MVDFASLRSSGKRQTAELQEKVAKQKNKNSGDYIDPRFWYPNRGEDGNASATIRFLPAPPNEQDAFVKIVSYKFSGPGGTYSEKSLTTLPGGKDPVAKYNSEQYKKGEVGQADAKTRTQSKTFISNIYVIKDALHPENEGKVFLYRYGPTIFDMQQVALNPWGDKEMPDLRTTDEIPLNPFSLFGPPRGADHDDVVSWIDENGFPGANFRMKIRTKSGPEKYADYSHCTFDSPSTLGNFSDEKLEEIWRQCYSLQEFLDPKNFKSYEELEAKMRKVLFDDETSTGKAPSTGTPSSTSAASSASKPAASQGSDEDFDAEYAELLAGIDAD